MKHSPTVSDPDADTQALLRRVGDTVRAARTARRMPRRTLSDLSGVSARYLAQLEGGQGNISIALLQRVAAALDLGVIDLLLDPLAEQEADLLNLFRRADAATQAAVVRRLEAAAEVPDKAHRICLIGLRGAGKSTLGHRAGHALDVPFLELNKDIERTAGMPVGEIMGLYGSEGYRQMESEAVRRIAARHDKIILAVGGGIVSDRDAYETVLSRFHTIWVKASPEEHMSRVRAQGDMRPMQGQAGAMDQLRNLLNERTAEYARADARVDTSGKTAEQSLDDLLSLIALNGFLD